MDEAVGISVEGKVDQGREEKAAVAIFQGMGILVCGVAVSGAVGKVFDWTLESFW